MNGKWTCIVKELVDDSYTVHIIMYDRTFVYYDGMFYFERFATEEEKEKLFRAIDNNGYRWNTETKSLEKLLKPYKKETINKAVFDSNAQCCDITNHLIKEETKTLEKLVEPKFHKGDWIVFNGLTLYIKEVVKGFYRTISKGDGIANSYDLDIDNTARLWTIQDAKDGDVLFHSDSASNGIFIFKEILQRGTIQKVICYCDYDSEDGFCLGENHTCCWTDSKILHPATKTQRDILFVKMKEEGYEWIAKTKTLNKLLKFNVGDKIKSKDSEQIINTITKVYENSYELNDGRILLFNCQDNWELAPNKFDINTLKPFDKVLARDSHKQVWIADFFSHKVEKQFGGYTFDCIGHYWRQCIPYEGNEHLLGTTDNCEEYYKIWK